MGFNVSCGISNLGISYGSEARFIILLPKKSPALLPTISTMLYCNDSFNPAALPVKGKYNEYGGLMDVVKDTNVLALESRYDLPIEDIIHIISSVRGVEDSMSLLYKYFATHKEEMMGQSDYLGDKLLAVGFEEETEGVYVLDKFPDIKIKILRDSMFAILRHDEKVKTVGAGKPFKNVQQFYQEDKGYNINVSPENQLKVQELSMMAGMFVKEEIYQHLANPLEVNLRSEYCMLEEEAISHYDSLLEQIKTFNEDTKGLDSYQKMKLDMSNPLSNFRREMNLIIRELIDVSLFSKLYDHLLTEEDLKREILDFFFFKQSMYSLNKFYFPTMNGEGGNNRGTKSLAELTAKLAQKAIEEAEIEEYEDDE